jgi:uncharacterized protein
MITTNDKNTATLIHLSTLTQYFIPFGGFIFPFVIWNSKKRESEFIDFNGKQTLNFQISILLYTFLIILITVPVIILSVLKNISMEAVINDSDLIIENFSFGSHPGVMITGIILVLLFFLLKATEFILIIFAALKTSNGEVYKYPLSIPFIK